MLQRPKSIMMKEVSAQTRALSVVIKLRHWVLFGCFGTCNVEKKNVHSQISQTFTTKVFPVCTEWVSRVCAQGIIKITNHGQVKQIRTTILMQPVLRLLNHSDQSKMLMFFFFAHCPLMICGPPGLEGWPLPTEWGSSPNSVDSAWRLLDEEFSPLLLNKRVESCTHKTREFQLWHCELLRAWNQSVVEHM